MARLFDNPLILLILVVVIVLVFASAKLPDMARSLGRSARVLKSEVGEMKKDGKDDTVDGEATEVRAEARPSSARTADTPVRDDSWNPDDHAQQYDERHAGSRLSDPTRATDERTDGTRLN
ncbi:Sec-independent protein translocase subunit TatA [Kytococcus sp. Marseille-QA3725]